MAQEIERKWIAEIRPDFTPTSTEILEQAYLSVGEVEVRIRRIRGAGEYELTVKRSTADARVRGEVNLSVSNKEGSDLWALTDPNLRITKMRDVAGRFEVDTYMGRHAGLVVAEAELRWKSEHVDPPTGLRLLKDVTKDARFKNQTLAGMTPLEIATLLEENGQ